MKMNKTIILVILISLNAIPIYSQDKATLAIVDFEEQNVSAMDARVITGFLRTAFVNAKKYRIVDRNNMERILEEQQFQMSGCTTSECAVKLGKLLNVKQLIIGSISNLMNIFYISANVVDVETGEIIISKIESCKLPEELVGCMRKLAAKLMGEEIVDDDNAEDGDDDGMSIIPIKEVNEEMILIPAGEFVMGADTGNLDNQPSHKVRLDAFYIDKYEVTNEQYKEFINTTAYRTPKYWNDTRFNRLDQPVVGVSWDDANAYANWAGKRLPTEAEWEKSAQLPEDYRNIITVNNYNLYGNSNSSTDMFEYTAPLGSYEKDKSLYGIYDMYGNVNEWVSDFYGKKYYKKRTYLNPKGPVNGRNKVVRGGAWDIHPFDKEDEFDIDYFRMYHKMRVREDYIGFRCAKDVE